MPLVGSDLRSAQSGTARTPQPSRPIVSAWPRSSRCRRSAPQRAPREPEPLWRDALGDQLRRIRHDRGERLADTADRAGVSPQYLSEMERGLKEPSSEMIAAVAGALEVTLIDLTAAVLDELRSRSSDRAAEHTAVARPCRSGSVASEHRSDRSAPSAGIRQRASVARVSPAKSTGEILDVDGHEVRVSSPDKFVFPKAGLTKLDVVRYFLAVATGLSAAPEAGRWCSSAS